MSLETVGRRIVGTITVAGEASPRVELSPAASALLGRLWEQYGPLMFHQSGGCCDGSAPSNSPAGEFDTSDADVLLGELELAPGFGGEVRVAPFWMSTEQFAYWRHASLVVDVVPGRGSGFSVEAPEGVRFLIPVRTSCGAELSGHEPHTTGRRALPACSPCESVLPHKKLAALWCGTADISTGRRVLGFQSATCSQSAQERGGRVSAIATAPGICLAGTHD